ncbi:MAG: hypothetical protein SGPRY_005634 [Prymnesium sp.]
MERTAQRWISHDCSHYQFLRPLQVALLRFKETPSLQKFGILTELRHSLTKGLTSTRHGTHPLEMKRKEQIGGGGSGLVQQGKRKVVAPERVEVSTAQDGDSADRVEQAPWLCSVCLALVVSSVAGFQLHAAPRFSAKRAGLIEAKVGLIYSTTTGNTETVAGYLAAETSAEMQDIADVSKDEMMSYDGLTCGAATWHTGAVGQYGDLASMDLKGKKVAVFGLGDQSAYSDNFCDAIDELVTCFKNQAAEIVGSWPTDGYDHTESKSVEGGKFVGLPCDEDNQPEMSEERVLNWIVQLKSEGMPV